MTVKKGDRVAITSDWSSFRGQRGTVIQTHPYITVQIDGDSTPIRIGDREYELVQQPS